MVLIGRLTKDAVVAQLKDERKVVNFTIAVNDYYKPKGSEKGVTATSFINCAYWISPAIAERLIKGSLVEIAGRLSVNAYTSMQGEAKASLNCHADSIRIHQQVKADATKSASTEKELVQDGLPF
jgi:single-strand DNA-binding protein